MRKLMPIAERHKLPVVEDACQGILADIEGKRSGTWGIAGGFSLHPLKNLNVWADGGVIVTNDDAMNEKLRLLRNHGLKNRDEISILGYNSRLDSVQAIVGNWLIKDTHDITDKRIANAAYYDAASTPIPQVRVPPRPADCKRVFHLYIIVRRSIATSCSSIASTRASRRRSITRSRSICRKASPISATRQGDFPVTDRHAGEIISFPCDQHLARDQQDYVIDTVRDFYKGKYG